MIPDKLSITISESKGALIDFLKRLVEVPTVVPPGDNYRDAISLVQDKLKDIGFKCKVVETPLHLLQRYATHPNSLRGPRPNLIAAKEWSSGGPNILLNGHIDVVPPGDGWKFPPFSATIKDNLMFGRGTADMKGSIASMVFALHALSQLESDLRGTVTLTVTVDEEIGGATGLYYLVKNNLVGGDCCLVADSTIESIKYASNGCLRFRIVTYGRSAHSSRPWMGVNAIEKMSKVINVLNSFSQQLSSVKSRIPAHPSFEVDHLRPSLSVCVISGGIKVNMIPDRCEILVDRRLIPEEDVREEAKRIIATIIGLKKTDPDLLVTAEYNYFHESFESDQNDRAIQLLSRSYREVTGVSPFMGGTLGCSDACYTAKIGIPTMLLGAARAQSGMHARNESVDLNDVTLFSRILAVFLKSVLSSNE
nr:ArgE/DapE family deacylase [Candidatus Njordarchaeum guaymaensis]